ncbi:uncharacterized protein LOC142639868 [Castanea sativa]|uniref:uncharacterized protein LOC142639868 n=1 Tax=Castanea sativa TaxID=21020 RepID=UPI003F64B6AD
MVSPLTSKKDKWIPHYPSNTILHPVSDMKEGWKVSDLIDWDLHRWRRDILMAKFNRDEVEAVCRIPLSRRVVEDNMVWLHNKKGEYTYRSMYHLARQILCATTIRVFPRMLYMSYGGVVQPKMFGQGVSWCYRNFRLTILILVDRLSTAEMKLFLVQAWLIWTQRNVVVHGGQMKNPRWLTNRAAELLEDYKKAQTNLVISSAAPDNNCWKLPPQDVYKLNFDAAVFSNLNCSGVGAIIRNFAGEVMVGMAAKGEFVHNSDDAEALACRKALEFAIEARFSDLVIEGDNSNVMRAILTTVLNNSFLGHIMDDIRHFILGRQFVGFSCVRRNMVTHSLARFARDIVEDLYWIKDEPHLLLYSSNSSISYKFNFDEAIFEDENIVDLGEIIRDENGLIMDALSHLIPPPISVEMVEVLTRRQSIWFVRELGFEKVIGKGDSELVIRAIVKDNMSSFG